LWYSYTEKAIHAITRKKQLSVATWMNLKIIRLSESQTTEQQYCMIPNGYISRKCKLIYSDRKQMSVT
jgi:hypothetical protein